MTSETTIPNDMKNAESAFPVPLFSCLPPVHLPIQSWHCVGESVAQMLIVSQATDVSTENNLAVIKATVSCRTVRSPVRKSRTLGSVGSGFRRESVYSKKLCQGFEACSLSFNC